MRGFLARLFPFFGLGRGSSSFGLGVQPSGSASIVPIPGCGTITFEPTAITTISFEATAESTASFEPTAITAITFEGC